MFYWPFGLLQTFLNIIFFYCNARNSRGSCQFSHIKNLSHLPYSIPSPYHVNVIKYDLSAANRWCSHNSLFIPRNTKKYEKFHCMKSVRFPSFSDPYFLAFGLNTQTLSLRIQSEYRKKRIIKTPNTNTFFAEI